MSCRKISLNLWPHTVMMGHTEMVNKLSIKKPCYVYRYFQGVIVKTDSEQIQVNHVMTEIKSNFSYICFALKVIMWYDAQLVNYVATLKSTFLINSSNIYKQENWSFLEETTYRNKTEVLWKVHTHYKLQINKENRAFKNIFIHDDVQCTKYMWSYKNMVDVLWLLPGNNAHGHCLYQE
jgi:hypothetical protein